MSDVIFVEKQVPALESGDYEITTEQELTWDGQSVDDQYPNKFSTTRNFTIAGPRFNLDPSTIYTRFPPPGSLGDHSNVLPHITFYRGTLPWERTPCEDDDNDDLPWLALLVFDETEAGSIALEQVMKQYIPDYNGQYGGLEHWENGTDLVTMIEVPRSTLTNLVPDIEDLKLTAHARQTAGDPLAVVVANRLPVKGGTSTVHLVSLENQYRDGTFQPSTSANGTVWLVSLASWEFSCTDADQDFGGLLAALDGATAADGGALLRLPFEADSQAKDYLERGYVPLNHYWREGATLVSWFHGPLIPGERALSDPTGDTTDGTITSAWESWETNPYDMAKYYGFDVPAPCADALVRYQPDTTMLDVSYAAAWEMGRLLALQDKAYSIGLYNWKRTVIRALKNEEHEALYKYLPIYGPEIKADEQYLLPAYQKAWLQALSYLEGVPFNYIVPHESILPVEAIRFFKLDPLWILCLLDGAFSIGRTLESDIVHEDNACITQMPAYNFYRSGFLLRSQLVAGWPDLVVTGYDTNSATPDTPLDMRQVKLGEQVMLCIFDGEITTVTISQKPESIHFGLNTDGTTWYKELRTLGDAEPSSARLDLDDSHFCDTARGIVNLNALASSMAGAFPDLSQDLLNTAQFGLEMVVGVDAVTFAGINAEL